MEAGLRATVFVCDEHPIIHIGVAACFEDDADIVVVGAGAWSEETVAAAANSNPDVLIFDLNQTKEGKARLRRLNKACPKTKLLIFTGDSELEDTVDALQAGASGLITKWGDPAQVRLAVTRLVRGDNYLEPNVAMQVISALKKAEDRRRELNSMQLTFREEQVLKCLLKGATNSQIGESLRISEKTVKHYIGCLKDKFNAANRLEVVLSAQRYSFA
ncbi:MAG: response regulator transcription factor [Rhodobacteraceae bacterium]|nr:response regulator transcription factor [Paracoccaceae bacterium]MCZ8334893.1 response regulator transcription factor [Paracoccaceae bacterium]